MIKRTFKSPAPISLVGSSNSTSADSSVALIGNFPPLKCGIATFTNDLVEQLAIHQSEVNTLVYALCDAETQAQYGSGVRTVLRSSTEEYRSAAKSINASKVDTVWLQHEYGIFGGPDGEMVCDLVDRIAAPLVVTLHTVLTDPSPNQRRILEHLVARASRIMVMSEHSRELLATQYGAPNEIVRVIPHGAPDRPFGRQNAFKEMLGLERRDVLTTFGLLGPGKGLERVIEALPRIAEKHPQVLYRIVGATHPNLVAQDGEAYRERLIALAEDLGVSRHVDWDDRFLDTDELLDQLEACDIYLTPYPNLQQSTSGTLSYAVALGKAVVSSPYVHARELLADDVGLLIEPDDSDAIADAVIDLLDDRDRLSELQRRAYAKGRETIWPEFARRAADLVREAAAGSHARAPVAKAPNPAGFLAMCDDTGMLQHGIGIVPDRNHGYCLDDNARALSLIIALDDISDEDRMLHAGHFASFIQSAWNDDKKAFRNFMAYDRQWCEDIGSEDSNGRAVWALGNCAAHAPDADLREWAGRWFVKVLPHMLDMGSPRAVAFTMLGAASYLERDPEHGISLDCLRDGADLLKRLFTAGRRPDWAWFEAVLGYDNPRLCQALLEAARILGDEEAREIGLDTLKWISAQQTSAEGHFRPIGSDSFDTEFERMPFDQQPLEAQAAIEAACIAYDATADVAWRDHATRAWQWFFGANDRGAVLADLDSGRCRDGVTPRGTNENCGAESILAFHLSHYSMLRIVDYGIHSAGPPSAKTGEQNRVDVSGRV
ncbi:glycosyltransferase [Erythrobacter litoralis]|uniref:glycosyltransferase family 4 protein n=1 Tax=Erythrobacter litoralis TaxID=39960 RepID=UPI0024356293|nr:glycosyltransferase family 4 protein [Erythrobacter litoralis]MDG6080098.1 glycosyltransferase [Erythrobacter litoralis]